MHASVDNGVCQDAHLAAICVHLRDEFRQDKTVKTTKALKVKQKQVYFNELFDVT